MRSTDSVGVAMAFYVARLLAGAMSSIRLGATTTRSPGHPATPKGTPRRHPVFSPDERALVGATDHYNRQLEVHRRALALASRGPLSMSHDWAVDLNQRARTAEFLDPTPRTGGIQ
jgi:hypothetical protein